MNTGPQDNTTPRPLYVILVIARRDLTRMLRQPSRIIAAIGTPALLWAFLASGFADAIKPSQLETESYDAFLLPGMMMLVAVFSAIFSSISLIEDRRAGWLQGVLVSPAPRWTITLGKILGATLVAWAQTLILLAGLPFVGLTTGILGIVIAAFSSLITSFAMAGLGFLFAWRSPSTASFHAVMNLLFMPMWLLSGAFFPMQGAVPWLQWIMWINPMTWCTSAMRDGLADGRLSTAFLAMSVFAGLMFLFATLITAIPTDVSREPQVKRRRRASRMNAS